MSVEEHLTTDSARPRTTSNIDLDRLEERLATGGVEVRDLILDVGFDVFDTVLPLAIPGILALTALDMAIKCLCILRGFVRILAP